MLTIASNITTRNPRVLGILRERATGSENPESETCPGLKDIAESCAAAGADVLDINIQQHLDNPATMAFAVRIVQSAVDCQLCLSASNTETLEAGLKACRRPPILNYVTLSTQRLKDILPLAAKYRAELILLASDPASPLDAEGMLEQAAVLVGAANESGIPNDRLILDLGLFHITAEAGQRHLVEVMELLEAIPNVFDPPIRSTCWLGNSSAGAPARLRPVIENTLLPLLSGVGLSSVFLDVLRRETKRTLNLLKVFRNEQIYTDSLLQL
ncbi:MAG TPA: dihydropteroate synthase [Dehalococcoidales bacterium]|jgi:cobalamin-dependent methionine synthase I